MTHTPGPWGFEDMDNPEMVTAGKSQTGWFRYVCEVLNYCSDEEAKANAHLIAAAPTLLLVLEELAAAIERSHTAIPLATVWAAIAAAKGETS